MKSKAKVIAHVTSGIDLAKGKLRRHGASGAQRLRRVAHGGLRYAWRRREH